MGITNSLNRLIVSAAFVFIAVMLFIWTGPPEAGAGVKSAGQTIHQNAHCPASPAPL